MDLVPQKRVGSKGAARRFDVVVLGGGAGGLVAAREARRRGATVALVHDGEPGGDCTFTGCVPSKALISAAARGASFIAAMTAVRSAVERIAATENAATLRGEGIEVLDGWGRFTSRRTLVVDNTVVRSKRFIVATGSRPAIPEIPGFADLSPLTNETIFDLERSPDHLVVVGGGAIGCELAQAFARLGTAVTLIESGERLLAREEPETSAVVTSALRADGVTVHTSTDVVSAQLLADGVARLHVGSAEVIDADRVLVATGRVPAVDGFGLEELGVVLGDARAIVVDDTMATNVGGVWAIGDVTGQFQFTHAAARMGWVAVANATSRTSRLRPARFDPTAMPWVTFTSPEVGRVGLTEDEAARRYASARVAVLPMTLVDRAVTVGDTAGFVKLIAAPRHLVGHLGGGRLVGATVVAPTGGELIHEAALAMQTNMFLGRLAQTTHAYPTWSMAIQQAALQFFGESSGLRARAIRARSTDGDGQ